MLGAEKKKTRIWRNIKRRLREAVIFQIHYCLVAKNPDFGKQNRFVAKRLDCLSKIVNRQATPIDDAFESADGNRFAAVHGNYHLTPICMPPFLMAAFLTDHRKTVFTQDTNYFPGVADWEAFAHVSATSTTLAPGGTEAGDGSNHSSNASFALRIASSSVSPAEAQPGNSGKNAAHRFVSGSCSTTNRSFMRF
jgi:hypothetical protein